MSTQSIAFEVALDNAPYEKAIELVTAALKTEGFGILTRIDVRATLKEKIDADFRPYAILGACNPPLAHRALSHDAEVGLMLPCNVTVEATPAGGSMVRIADPNVFMQVGQFQHDKELRAIASEARERLLRAVGTLNAAK
ncbi:MAG: DUF302 domain-containing protein [Rhodocyclaceae bacterium]|jgi:uncharacterized protein (DUF302 family)|nr:DUF302 domain-containing protein [Rhodocyclaceae bacterium]